MARSVTEILPRPFAELTLDDVAQIVADHRNEGETLFFERKAEVSANSLSKACAAFANTYGGLLVVGVADEDDTLAGIEPRATEAQLWVKDTLRGLVLPMPSFRARWIDTDDGRGLLLVLVEESSTTPHLLTRSGAIYVRNPGSSDPVPIADQRRLLDLTARGDRAVSAAKSSALAALDVRLFDEDSFFTRAEPSETLAVAATGVSADFETRIFDADTPESISVTTWGETSSDARSSEGRWAAWGQHVVGVQRNRDTPLGHTHKAIEESAALIRSGVALMRRGFVSRPDRDWKESRHDGELRAWFDERFTAAKELLLNHGAHGDLRLVYKLDLSATTGVYFEAIANVGPFHRDEPIMIEIDTTFDDASAGARVFAELLRVSGHGPTATQPS